MQKQKSLPSYFGYLAGITVFLCFLLSFSSALAQQAPALSLVQTADYDSKTGSIAYRLTWKIGGGAAQNVVVSNTIPVGATLAPQTGAGGGQTLSWKLGDRSAGEQGELVFTVGVDAARSLSTYAMNVVQFTGTSTVDTSLALGAPNTKGVLLGPGESLTVRFPVTVHNATGTDLGIFAVGGGEARVEVSNNLTDWIAVGAVSGSGEVDLGSLPEAVYARVTGVSDRFELDAAGALHKFPFACALLNQATITANIHGQFTQSVSSTSTDLHAGCNAAYSGSGIPTGVGGGSVNPPEASSGGSGSSTTTPGGHVQGIATTTPEGAGGFSLPPFGDVGGGEVAGTMTLPRTGAMLEYGFLLLVLLAIFLYSPEESLKS